jgi:hypothetical protein
MLREEHVMVVRSILFFSRSPLQSFAPVLVRSHIQLWPAVSAYHNL